ncbi:MAG: GNAT family N-acetyltransferase [Proteobacteria bacterium]|uniref:GNAT family N-acetyltransferase n=1 Tax=Rudaea sp. TaxID=2136325 RepID=UPI00321F8D72|nr:GNAT family N-acetyltransferase [Pseudomonadota bacterium]
MPAPHPDISIRAAVDGDLGALLALEHASFTSDHLSRRQYRQHLHSATADVLAAADAVGLLGKAVVFYRAGSDIARLYSIAVAERARGRGVAKALMAAVEVAARRRQCARLRLEVRKGNTAAIALYERLGFRRFGEKRGFYEDGADAWRYEKRLTRDE